MGTYVLYLSTKKKNAKCPDGSSIEVFSYRYLHKYSFREPSPWITALKTRISNIWDGRSAPEYVCYSSFDPDDYHDIMVYRAKAIEDRMRSFSVIMSDIELEYLEPAGFLCRDRKTGKYHFEPLFKYKDDYKEDVPHETMKSLFRGKFFTYIRRTGNSNTRWVFTTVADDLAVLRLLVG